jgi:hypothetical protein
VAKTWRKERKTEEEMPPIPSGWAAGYGANLEGQKMLRALRSLGECVHLYGVTQEIIDYSMFLLHTPPIIIDYSMFLHQEFWKDRLRFTPYVDVQY